MSMEQYPTLKPVPGLVLEAYMSRADIGSGLRFFVIYKVGRKYVHLFYAPHLSSIRLRRSEFATLYMQPLTLFKGDRFKRNLRAIMIRDASKCTALLETICNLEFTCGEKLFAAAKVVHISKPTRNVKRG